MTQGPSSISGGCRRGRRCRPGGYDLALDLRDPRIAELEAENDRLRRTGVLYRAAVESAHDFAIFTTDLTGTITSWDPGTEKTLGWAEAAAVGQHARLIFTPDDLAGGAYEHEIDTATSEGRAEDERWHLRVDGSRFWASGLVMRLEAEQTSEHTGLLKVLRDQTAKHETSERATAGEARVRFILDGAVDALYGVDSDGVTTFCNTAFLRLLGFAREEDAIGRTLHDLIHH